jgi:hypothetical protein
MYNPNKPTVQLLYKDIFCYIFGLNDEQSFCQREAVRYNPALL